MTINAIKIICGMTIIAAANFASEKALASSCDKLPKYEAFKKALGNSRKADNGGLNFDMWGSLVTRDGTICAVAFTGEKTGDQWLGSRVISAQKANTAISFNLPSFALSTANLYSIVQPGGFAFGIQESNPVDTKVAYKGNFKNYGTTKDPMVGEKLGGINVFGGGLALYDDKGEFIGGIGVSGDSSCADHLIAWRLRHEMNLDYVPAGPAPTKDDQIIFDIVSGKSKSGFGQPTCGGKEADLISQLPAVRKVSKK